MKIIREQTSKKKILQNKEVDLGDTLKIVVDINLGLIGMDAEMHADIEQEMLEAGSAQADLWGANLILSEDPCKIEYTSFINIRPGQNNRSMEIQDKEIRERVKKIITELIR